MELALAICVIAKVRYLCAQRSFRVVTLLYFTRAFLLDCSKYHESYCLHPDAVADANRSQSL